jgi:putative AdoMet-dependent methyltransferase
MYYNLLPKRGKVIIGDTMFLSHENYELVKKESYDSNKLNLLEDLEREYYPLILDMETYFREAGFRTKFNQINQFAWIIEAVKN